MIDRPAIALVWSAIGETPPPVDRVSTEELPTALREVLTARDGFTAALAARTGGTIGIRVLGSIRPRNDGLARFSELVRKGDGRTIALVGLVIDEPGVFDERVFARVVAEREPFGTILAEAGIAFQSRVGGYFRVGNDPRFAGVGAPLLGRTADLVGSDGNTVARVVEIPLEG